MNEIYTTVLSLLPPSRKITSGGWTSFNSVCCEHRGETHDTKYRGGIKDTANGGWTVHCFNCKFAAGWSPGKLLSANARLLFGWLGLSEEDIGKLALVALRLRDTELSHLTQGKVLDFELNTIELPAGAKPISEWIAAGTVSNELVNVINYIDSRGMEYDWCNWHYSDSREFKDRVIIPFYSEGKIVGYTGRIITDQKKFKYMTKSQSGYVFNIDNQTADRAYAIVTEGQFDAIAIDGVAIMTNIPNAAQVARLKMLGKEIIMVPDRDPAGASMLNAAIEHGWSVSLPPWETKINDVADAVKHYGRLYVLTTILQYRVTGEIKIKLIQNKLKAL